MEEIKKTFKSSICLTTIIIFLALLSTILFVEAHMLNNDVVALTSELENKNESLEQYENKIGEYEDAIEEKEEEVAKAKEYSEELENHITTLNNENAELTEEIILKNETVGELFEYANAQAISENYEIKESSWNCNNGRKMLYALYIPNGLDKEEPLPLILYLHASGESGSNLRLLENCPNGFSTFVYDGRIAPNAYIIMPQTPDGSWDAHTGDLMNLILDVCENYNVDMSRISITGHSLGGYGTLSMLYTYPNFFSAAAPLSSSANVQKCRELIKIPIWFFVGQNDNPNPYKQANDAINESGGQSKITVYQNEGHRIPPHYLDNDCEIVTWLISQERKE